MKVKIVLVIATTIGPAVGWAQNADRALPPFYSTLDASSLTATRERPLFEPTRRPPAPAPPPRPEIVVATPPVIQPAPPQVRLIGVLSAGGTRMALVEDGATGEILRIRPGDGLSDWSLSIVDDRTIVFRRDGEIVEYSLFEH